MGANGKCFKRTTAVRIECSLRRAAVDVYKYRLCSRHPAAAAQTRIRRALLSTFSIQGGLQSGGVKPQADHLTQHGGRAGGTQGLGEMMPEQLWATTMDPSSRTLKRLTVADAAEASDVFSLLMGHQVSPNHPPPLRDATWHLAPWQCCPSSY